MKKIIITGATGLIGKELCHTLVNRGDKVTIFTRNVDSAKRILGSEVSFVKWNHDKPAEWQDSIKDHDAIIHLAGANLSGKRWTDNYKKVILESRIKSTNALVTALRNSNHNIKTLISSSAVGYYGSQGENTITENSEPGKDFLAKVCVDWENEAAEANKLGIRTVILRQGVVLSVKGGALKKFLLPYKFFVGGALGNGKQWFPWIHINDLVSSYLLTLDNSEISGAINVVTPMHVRMNEFAKTLGVVLNRPSFFKVPEFVLRLAVGEVTSSIVSSQKIIPQRLIDLNFQFEFADLESALIDLLKTKRA